MGDQANHPQGRPTSGSPDGDWTLQDTAWPRALPLLMPGPPPGNTKIPSSHCRSHCDICGLWKDGGAQFPQSQQPLQGEFCQDMRNQQGGSDPCSPATCRSHGDLWQPDCPGTASPTKPQNHQVHTATGSVQTQHSSTTHSCRLQTRHQDLL